MWTLNDPFMDDFPPKNTGHVCIPTSPTSSQPMTLLLVGTIYCIWSTNSRWGMFGNMFEDKQGFCGSICWKRNDTFHL